MGARSYTLEIKSNVNSSMQILDQDPMQVYEKFEMQQTPKEDGHIFKVRRIDDTSKVFAMMVLSEPSANAYQKILNEASLLKSLNIDEMLKWVAVHSHDNKLTLIFEYMDHLSLAKIIENYNDKYGEDFCRFTLFNVAMCLSQMHKKNVLHRQLMPENVFSSSAGEIKLADLGVKLAPIYAPEIVNGDPFTKKSDVWMFGCLAYALATGTIPYLAQSEFKLLNAIVAKGQQPEPIPSRWSDRFRDFIQRCLEKNPDQRPTIDELLEDDFFAELGTNESKLQECKEAW